MGDPTSTNLFPKNPSLNNPQENQPAPVVKPRAEVNQPSRKADIFKGASAESQARNIAQRPDILGRRLPEVRHRPQFSEHHQGRFETQKMPLPRQFRQLMKDPAVARLRDSKLYQILKRLSVHEKGDRDRPRLTKEHVRQLVRLRHGVSDRPNIRQILRFEIRQLKRGSEKFGHKESSQEGKKSKDAQNKKNIDSESYIKRASKNLTLQEDAGESRFESILKKVLKGQKQTAKPLPEGREANFKGKSASGWKQFFSNVLKRGSAEVPETKENVLLQKALYRGAFSEGKNNKTSLVADLSFQQGPKVATEKFVRVAIENPSLLQTLEHLSPGEVMSRDLMDRLGKDLKMIKLVHQTTSSDVQEAQQEALMHHLKSPSNPENLQRMEQALLMERQRRDNDIKKVKMLAAWGGFSSGAEQKKTIYPFLSWWDPRKVKKNQGKPKFLIFVAYSMGLAVIGLSLFILFKSL